MVEMLARADVERAATAAVQHCTGWRVDAVHRSGALAWIIDYSTPDGVLAVNILVDSDSTEVDVQRLIEKRLPS